MSRFIKSSVLILIIVTAAGLVAGCSSRFESVKDSEAAPVSAPAVSQVNASTSEPVQTNEGGSVTFEVEWIEVKNPAANDSLTFHVAMNTHSVDLDDYDLGELATLRDDSGNEYQPVSWESEPGGHHRSGTLVFRLPDSLRQGRAGYVEVVIRNVAGIDERVLKWAL